MRTDRRDRRPQAFTDELQQGVRLLRAAAGPANQVCQQQRRMPHRPTIGRLLDLAGGIDAGVSTGAGPVRLEADLYAQPFPASR